MTMRKLQAQLNVERLEARELLSVGYYVSLTGSDSYAGTSEMPWKTINHVNMAIKNGYILPGDTIHFHRGNTFTGNLVFDGVGGAPGAPITITDYDQAVNSRAVIQAGDGTGISIRN